MKKALLFILLLQPHLKAKAQLSVVDSMLNDTSKTRPYVTAPVASRIIYNAQRFVGGTAVKQGKLLGTSATIDEQSLTVNVGTNILRSCLALQGNLAGTGKDDFISLFRQGEYQKTITLGGTANWFINGIRGKTFLFFEPHTRDSLHTSLRLLRNQNRDSLEDLLATVRTTVWNTRYAKVAEHFYDFWHDSTHSKLLSNLRSKVILQEDYEANRRIIQHYDSLCRQMRPFLPLKWDKISYGEAFNWVYENLGNKVQRDSRIEVVRIQSEKELQKRRSAVYDSIQLAAPWTTKKVNWVTISYLKNRDKQSIFTSPDASNLDIIDKTQWSSTYRAGFNHLVLRHFATHNLRWYYGLTGTLSTQRLFASQDPTNRFALDSHYLVVHHDTVRTINQAAAFNEEAIRPFLFGMKFQGSVFSENWKVGLDFTGQWQYSKITEPHYVTTIGIFIPVPAGETTLIVMPQAKYDSRTFWNVGFSLSAAIPGFVTKSEL